MRKVFIATRNVTEFQRAMSVLIDTEKGQPGLGVVQGFAGLGKTLSAQSWHAQHNGESFYVRVWENWSQNAMLQKVCFEVCGERHRSANANKARVIDSLDGMRGEGRKPVLFIDEADRLPMTRINDFRDIHDETGVPVVLIGEEGMSAKLAGSKRVLERVSQKVVFGPVTADDVLLFTSQAAGLKLTPEACKQLLGSCDGNFRRLYTLTQALEQACKAKGAPDVDAAMVQRTAKERLQ